MYNGNVKHNECSRGPARRVPAADTHETALYLRLYRLFRKEAKKYMNILVISDTHGRIEKAAEIHRILSKDLPISFVIHCGDHKEDADNLAKELGTDVLGVEGNCDNCYKNSFQITHTPSGQLLIVHGHMQNVGFTRSGLFYLAEQYNCVAVCYGHTHVPAVETADGITVLNPGSLTCPRDGSKNGSCALLTAEKGNPLQYKILYYDDIISKNENPPDSSGTKKSTKNKKSRKNGFLRRLMNYSDSL